MVPRNGAEKWCREMAFPLTPEHPPLMLAFIQRTQLMIFPPQMQEYFPILPTMALINPT
uniref:Uncharacterized protein n=1 Tax=Picea glauca TaxID=3330 RepID=A0A101M538_PICGL|nr:hypothetical protein ABT39_MTgene950 [Picea glauca]